MAVRWYFDFKTLNGSTGHVDIFDSTFTGTPIKLTPAANPFSTSRTSSDLFQPVIADNGYIRIIDNGDSSHYIDDIHPIGALDRQVEFYIGSTLKWRGYISPEAFTMDYGPTPRVVTFPIVGVLEILDTITITDNGAGLQSIAMFLYQALQATGFSWDNLIMCTQLSTLFDGNVDMYFYSVPELRLSLSKYNFLTNNDVDNVYDSDWTPMVGKSYLDVLKTICQFFGWTIIPDGRDIYLSSPIVDLAFAPVYISWSNLYSIAASPAIKTITLPTTIRPSLSFLALDWMGINHRKSVKNGYKKIVVSADVNDSNDTQPAILFNGDQVASQSVRIEGIMLQPRQVLIGKVNFFDPAKESIVLYSYLYHNNVFYSTAWSAPTGTFTMRPRADIVEGFTYTKDYYDTSDPTDNFKKYLRLCRREGTHDLPSNINYPLARLTANAGGFFPKDGALCFSCKVRNNYVDAGDENDTKGLSQWGPFLNKLRVAIRIGNYGYDGTEWTDSGWPIIEIEVTGSESGDTGYPSYYEEGVVKDTNDGQYLNVEGFIIPIEKDLVGKLSITFYSWNSNSIAGSTDVNTLFLSDISLQYLNNLLGKNKGTRLSSLTGIKFSQDLEVNLGMSSSKGTKKGNAILFWQGTPIGNLPYFFPNGTANPGYYLPELWLLEKLVEAYTKPATWLTLETKYIPSLTMWSIITYQNKNYIIVGMETDYVDERTKLTIATYQ